jgi:RNA-binding protein YhbY
VLNKGGSMAKTAILPGVEIEGITDEILTKLAEAYAADRDVRMQYLKTEVESKKKVIDRMNEMKIKTYHDDEANLTITLESKTTVKVKIGGEDDDEEE